MSRIPGLVWNVDTAGQATGGRHSPERRFGMRRRHCRQRPPSEHSVGAEHPVEDVADHRLLALLYASIDSPSAFAAAADLRFDLGERSRSSGWSRSQSRNMRWRIASGLLGTPDVEVRPRIVTLETAMLVPRRLPDPEHEPDAFERRDVRRLVARVSHGQVDVDRPAWHRGPDARRTDVLQSEHPVAEGVTHAVRASTSNTAGQARVGRRPRRSAAVGGGPTDPGGSSSGSMSSCRVTRSFVATTCTSPCRPSRSMASPGARPRSIPSRSRSSLDEGRSQTLRQDRGPPLANRQHRRIDGRARAERILPIVWPSSNSHHGAHPAVRSATGGVAACLRATSSLEHQIGPVGPTPGSIEQQRQQLGGDPNGGLATTRYGSFGNRRPTNVRLDHPHPAVVRPDGRIGRGGARPTPDPVRPPTPWLRSAAIGRVRAPLPATHIDDEVVRARVPAADEPLDQRLVNEEVLTERAPPLVPFGPAQSPGHGPSPSASWPRRYDTATSIAAGSARSGRVRRPGRRRRGRGDRRRRRRRCP